MGIYAEYVLPRVVDWACSCRPVSKQRAKVVPAAEGHILEIGFGTGLNLPHYDTGRVKKLWGLEPMERMRRLAAPRVRDLPFEFEFLDLPGDEIPLEAGTVDTVVVTYTLCSIGEPMPALQGMMRVLRPGGQLLFCEHGASPDAAVRRWQDRMTPLWKRLGGGCHLNRDIPSLLEAGGFRVDTVESMYIPGWRPASFNYWGAASGR